MSPLSDGTVKISPHASITARLPVGEIPKLRIRAGSTFTKCGRTCGRSPATRTLSVLAWRVFRSYSLSAPTCSITIAPGPADADLKSSPSFLTTSLTCLVLVS